MKFRHFIALRTDLTAEECLRRLNESIDPERRTIFSLSGYKGARPVIGWINGYEFYLHKRRYWRNDFAPWFYGNLWAQDRGTLVEGYFDLQRWTRVFMRLWLGGVLLLGTPILVLSLIELLGGRTSLQGDPRPGVLAPLGMVLFGILLPRFGLFLGRKEEAFIVEFLRNIMAARNVTQG